MKLISRFTASSLAALTLSTLGPLGATEISSVSFSVGAFGSPTGTVSVELWDDDGDDPVVLFDTFPTPDASSGHLTWPEHNRGASAQQFMSGELALVSSVT